MIRALTSLVFAFCLAASALSAGVTQFEVVELGSIETMDWSGSSQLSDSGFVLIAGPNRRFFLRDPFSAAGLIELEGAASPTCVSNSGRVFGCKPSTNRHKKGSFCWWDREHVYHEVPVDAFAYGYCTRVVDVNSLDVVVGTIFDTSKSGGYNQRLSQKAFIFDSGYVEILPLEEVFREKGVEARGFDPVAIDDAGNVVGRCQYGEMHPRKNKWIEMGMGYFFWDGESAHVIEPPGAVDESSIVLWVLGLGDLGEVFVRYSLEIGDEYANLTEERLGTWTPSQGYEWEEHYEYRSTGSNCVTKSANTGPFGLVYYEGGGIRIRPDIDDDLEFEWWTCEDLERASNFQQLFPGGKIICIRCVNRAGQILVEASLWGETHSLLLIPVVE